MGAVEERVLFEGDPNGIEVGDVADVVCGERGDGIVRVRVHVRLEDGVTVVTRLPVRARVTRRWVPCMGLLTLGLDIDVEVLPDDSPEALLELGRITKEEYWDMVEP